MAAGLGFKDFQTGEVLTAADVDGYLMQGIWVFANATARDAAVTSPQEGNFAYLKDTNVTTYYTGSAWTNLDTTGMTNPMTTTGDMVYSSSGSTPARLGIGTAGQVLKVNSGATAPEWGAAGGASGLTLVKRASFTSVADTDTTFDDVFTTTYKSYLVNIEGIFAASSGDDLQIQGRYTGPNTQAATYYGYSTGIDAGGNNQSTASNNAAQLTLSDFNGSSASAPISGQLFFQNVGNGSQTFGITGQLVSIHAGVGYTVYTINSTARNTYMGFLLKSASSNITGTVSVYGLATA
jgi:hypothetical protein